MIESFFSILELYITEYGYLIAFLFAAIENSLFIGLIFPGAIAVLIFGFYAAQGLIDPVQLILYLILGSVIGNNIGYYLGHRYGRRLIKKVGKYFHFEEEKFKYAEKFYKKNGPKTVMWGRMVAMLGPFIPFSAGISKMHYVKFLAYDFVGAVVWVTIMVSLGYFFGANWENVVGYVGNFGSIFLVLFGVVVYKFIKEQKNEDL